MQLAGELGAPAGRHAQQAGHPLVVLAERALCIRARRVAAARHQTAQQREGGGRRVGARGEHRRALGEQRGAQPEQSAPRRALALLTLGVGVGVGVVLGGGGGGGGLHWGERGGERAKELQLAGRWQVGPG